MVFEGSDYLEWLVTDCSFLLIRSICTSTKLLDASLEADRLAQPALARQPYGMYSISIVIYYAKVNL
jgi:hypothetical protein